MDQTSQASSDQIRHLQGQYESVVKSLSDARTERGNIQARLAVLTAEVGNWEDKKNLVLQNIQCEKKLMEVR